MSDPKAIRVNGVEYPSVSAAAARLRVGAARLRALVREQGPDVTADLNHKGHRKTTIAGEEFSSITEAAREFLIPAATLAARIRRGAPLLSRRRGATPIDILDTETRKWLKFPSARHAAAALGVARDTILRRKREADRADQVLTVQDIITFQYQGSTVQVTVVDSVTEQILHFPNPRAVAEHYGRSVAWVNQRLARARRRGETLWSSDLVAEHRQIVNRKRPPKGD